MCFTLFVAVLFFSSCKKEEDLRDPKEGSGMFLHYAYLKGFVFDSITGIPLDNVKVFESDWPFKDNTIAPIDSTGATGMYIRTVAWYEGTPYGSGWQTGKPVDSADIFINAYAGNMCGFIKIKGWQLIENDTITLSNIYTVEDAYITTHIKDTVGGPGMSSLYWYYVVGGYTYKTYGPNTDTLITFKVCPYQEIKFTYYGADSATVNSGDTAFVDVFY